MRNIVDDLMRLWHSGRTGGLVTLVRTTGSSPLPIGTAMVVDADGRAFGSLSAGCAEAAAYQVALEAARTGQRGLHRFGPGSGLDAGTDCHGTLDVFAEPFSRRHFPEFPDVAADILAQRQVTVFTVVWHADPDVIGQHLVTDRRHGTELVSLPDSDVFVSSFARPPHLILVGANAFASALAIQGRLLGYRVTIVDARPTFATEDAYPGCEVVVDWPHRYLNTLVSAGEIDSSTALVVLSHDAKFEIPLLTIALRLPELGYLAAMGSHTAHTHRLEALEAGGFDAATLDRLRSPAGLDLGASTPAETAVSIAAELLSVRNGTSAEPRSPHRIPA
ncbi:XdhC family protein [Nocardia huaxiensis]|uniref:XdhC family protein n=1 Tax=Nocardia huaxiensis TaxID=2755382 RepID=A0A7D6ZL03_9NOCA|nr:XdhC/CoxI family protein [Nocardia huaxiensis]QLY32200.1 XdhC family protein [Nocardia huaxiensis]UFS94097.1 XdhC family protein [Nocardia huaxiensis]